MCHTAKTMINTFKQQKITFHSVILLDTSRFLDFFVSMTLRQRFAKKSGKNSCVICYYLLSKFSTVRRSQSYLRTLAQLSQSERSIFATYFLSLPSANQRASSSLAAVMLGEFACNQDIAGWRRENKNITVCSSIALNGMAANLNSIPFWLEGADFWGTFDANRIRIGQV